MCGGGDRERETKEGVGGKKPETLLYMQETQFKKKKKKTKNEFLAWADGKGKGWLWGHFF